MPQERLMNLIQCIDEFVEDCEMADCFGCPFHIEDGCQLYQNVFERMQNYYLTSE